MKQYDIKRDKIPDDSEPDNVMNYVFLENISIEEIEENLVENFENESSDFVNLSDSGHSRNSEYLDSDFDPENSSEDSETEETQDSDTGNKLIMSSLENLNKIITDFAPSCPKCSCKDLFF